MSRSDNPQVRRYFDKIAPKYDQSMKRSERFVFGPARKWAASRAEGSVLELAVGTGLNLPLYPPSAQILGVDLSEAMVNLARARIVALGMADRARVEVADVQALDLANESFDTVVSTYTFCTIPEPAAAAAEAFRVLRAGGSFVLVEHGPSDNRTVAVVQRALDPVFVRLQADHIVRDPVPYLQAAGFRVNEIERSRLGMVFKVAATKPET